MGNFEKMVVLSILFLSAVVLGISLNTRGPAQAAGPLDAAEVLVAEGAEAIAPRTPLLDVVVPAPITPEKVEAPVVAPVAPVAPEVALVEVTAPVVPDASTRSGILISERGLENSPSDDYRLYRPMRGDTWASLATRFYGDRMHMKLLRSQNEGMESPIVGKAILVPVYDLTLDAGSQAPVKARAAHASMTPSGLPATYIVQPGDSLWKISKRLYGTGTRHDEIRLANLDRLSIADALQIGMELRIP